jgi:hypothetical protein
VIAARPRAVWLLATLAYFLMAAAWAVALPANGTYDERQHVVRAYAVASGQWLPPARDEGHAVRAPRSLVPEDADCAWRRPYRTADCQRPVSDATPVDLVTKAGRYSPVYYAPVGLPLLVAPDERGVLAARLVSALLSALLLGAAVAVAARLGRPLLAVAVALVGTPMAVNLAGSVNPNGLEISAAVLLFAALLALVREPAAAPRRLLLLAGLAAALLATVRHLGPLLVAVDVAACALLARPGALRELWRSRDARLLLGAPVAAAALFAVAWTLASGVTAVHPLPGIDAGPLHVARVRLRFWLQQVVGQFGYGEVVISKVAVAAWYALVAAVVLPALWWAGWRARAAVALLLAACAALLFGLELALAPRIGWSQHGRYAMPIGVGVVLVAGFLGWRTAVSSRSRIVAMGLVAATAPLHLYALARVMTRYQIGIGAGLDPFGGVWRPPLGTVAPLVALVAGLATLLATLLIVTVRLSTRGARTH